MGPSCKRKDEAADELARFVRERWREKRKREKKGNGSRPRRHRQTKPIFR